MEEWTTTVGSWAGPSGALAGSPQPGKTAHLHPSLAEGCPLQHLQTQQEDLFRPGWRTQERLWSCPARPGCSELWVGHGHAGQGSSSHSPDSQRLREEVLTPWACLPGRAAGCPGKWDVS